MTKRSPKQDALEPDAPASYEEAVSELEGLIARIDSGQLPLDQLFSQYQRGAYLLGFCRNRLQALEQQIQVMEEGVLRPWSPDA
jgi:exodeoxyribonuclease VII small subunit